MEMVPTLIIVCAKDSWSHQYVLKHYKMKFSFFLMHFIVGWLRNGRFPIGWWLVQQVTITWRRKWNIVVKWNGTQYPNKCGMFTQNWGKFSHITIDLGIECNNLSKFIKGHGWQEVYHHISIPDLKNIISTVVFLQRGGSN